ncbi:HeH/LEM domain-containing protein [Pseudomonas sp. SMSB3]|uniref:HeH/LEM domain-containing protein n=1 Tax=Pseudomonas sp. SMSB3 TaxID=3390196 RepID=UPI003F85042A
MKVIYTNTPGSERGTCYRRLDQFFGVIDGATQVVVEGEAPEIVEAYEAAGIKVGDQGGQDQPETDPHKMNVPELKEWLTAKGIEFDASAKKPDLQVLIPQE